MFYCKIWEIWKKTCFKEHLQMSTSGSWRFMYPKAIKWFNLLSNHSFTKNNFNKIFFSKYDQIRRKRWIWSHLLRISLMENFIFVQCYNWWNSFYELVFRYGTTRFFTSWFATKINSKALFSDMYYAVPTNNF